MIFKQALILYLLCLIFTVGCQDNQGETTEETNNDVQAEKTDEANSSDDEEYMYENESNGVYVSQLENWKFKTEESNPYSAIFETNGVQAIISIVETSKTIDELKEELIAGSGNSVVITSENGHLSYKTDNEESMQTNVFFEQRDDEVIMLSFVAPTSEMKEKESQINNFEQNLKY
ncbi:hypothetical protein [Aquisalibacillus elongatus]|uniref:Uncharacterized protein n=1 Tax=Aquisalibacillus elongatus TaxID=485577 RepID=A0A3N5C3T7_9BACI|nr:hypothetical protein [Aquisalibacillus elongatus]RPF54122.1 hypothetical protein EDC24_1311 [Aquisalibacillus elongatus]